MTYPTQAQEQAIIECETLLDYYVPELTGGTGGVDRDARLCLRLAAMHGLPDRERDALIRFVHEWAVRVAREVEVDRAWQAMQDDEGVTA